MGTTYEIKPRTVRKFFLFGKKSKIYNLIEIKVTGDRNSDKYLVEERTLIGVFKNYRDACIIKRSYENIL